MSRAAVSLAAQLESANQRLFTLRDQAQKVATSASMQMDDLCGNRPKSADDADGWLQPLTQVSIHAEPPRNQQDAATTTNTTTSFFPDIGLALLRQSREAVGRIWLLLRHCDMQGKGWIAVDDARNWLTAKDAPLRVCGWRQLRNLLRAGQGMFWERDKERIWLRSTAKVAAALGIERMENRPIALPLHALLGGIGTVRAHFYASFHSGRYDDNQSKPISRQTMTMLSGVGRDSQRSYERKANVAVRSNFALGQAATVGARQSACWQIGQHVFTFNDRQGNHGKPGASYLAWQLPNSYAGVHDQQPRRQRRRINRQLADLLNLGTTGNREQKKLRHYYHSGSELAKSAGSQTTRYCQQQPYENQQHVLWHAH